MLQREVHGVVLVTHLIQGNEPDSPLLTHGFKGVTPGAPLPFSVVGEKPGGVAFLMGLYIIFQERTGIEVHIAEDPEACVAIGTGKALNVIENIENNKLNRREPYL